MNFFKKNTEIAENNTKEYSKNVHGSFLRMISNKYPKECKKKYMHEFLEVFPNRFPETFTNSSSVREILEVLADGRNFRDNSLNIFRLNQRKTCRRNKQRNLRRFFAEFGIIQKEISGEIQKNKSKELPKEFLKQKQEEFYEK